MSKGTRFGDQIVEHFKDRGNVNAQGVDVVSIALGIETNNFDSIIQSFAQRSGFEYSGVDCVLEGASRMDFREGFSYYSGQSTSRIPSSSSLRSSIVVINGVKGSVSHEPWEVIYNSHSYSSSNRTGLLASIDAVQPGGGSTGVTYQSWAEAQGLVDEMALPLGDPDWDGLVNALEFYFDTSPTQKDANPLRMDRGADDRVVLRFPVGRERQGLRLDVEASQSLDEWWAIEVGESAWSMEEGELADRAMVTLPEDAGPYLRLRVSLEE